MGADSALVLRLTRLHDGWFLIMCRESESCKPSVCDRNKHDVLLYASPYAASTSQSGARCVRDGSARWFCSRLLSFTEESKDLLKNNECITCNPGTELVQSHALQPGLHCYSRSIRRSAWMLPRDFRSEMGLARCSISWYGYMAYMGRSSIASDERETYLVGSYRLLVNRHTHSTEPG